MAKDGPTLPSLAGMTVNERLFAADLLDKWETAARRRDRAGMIALLQQVEISEPAAIVDAVLADPKKYGF